MMDEQKIFSITTDAEFERLAIETFRFQYANVDVYRTYVDLLKN